MAIAFVQSNNGTTLLTPDPIAFVSNNTAGSLLIATARLTAVVGAISVSDTQGNTWVSAVQQQNNTAGRWQVIFYAKNCKAGANTVTITSAVSQGRIEGVIAEYSGLDTTAPLDQVAGANSGAGTGTVATAGPVTTTSASELLIGAFSNETADGLTFTAGASYTVRDKSNGNEVLEDRIVAATGSYSAPITMSSSVSWTASMATFKAAPVGISGNAGIAGATVSWTGTSSGSVTADGSGNYNTGEVLVDGNYTITPTKTGYTFAPVNSAQTIAGADIAGVNFIATATGGSVAYSVPDCRVPPAGPNSSRTVQGTKIYDVQTSSNSTIPSTDSRVTKPTDCRVSPNIPQNSRAPGTFAPGE